MARPASWVLCDHSTRAERIGLEGRCASSSGGCVDPPGTPWGPSGALVGRGTTGRRAVWTLAMAPPMWSPLPSLYPGLLCSVWMRSLTLWSWGVWAHGSSGRWSEGKTGRPGALTQGCGHKSGSVLHRPHLIPSSDHKAPSVPSGSCLHGCLCPRHLAALSFPLPALGGTWVFCYRWSESHLCVTSASGGDSRLFCKGKSFQEGLVGGGGTGTGPWPESRELSAVSFS